MLTWGKCSNRWYDPGYWTFADAISIAFVAAVFAFGLLLATGALS